MNVLVIGGHGFIGSHITDVLCDKGHKVRVLARKPSPYTNRAEWFYGDFLDVGKVAEALAGIDAVVHSISATLPATSALDPVVDILKNLIPTVQLLEAMQRMSVNRLIFISSGGTVYGNPLFSPVTEQHPLSPISNYGATKVAIEKFIGVAAHGSDLRPVILRPANPYGERQGHSGVQGLISTVLNNAFLKLPTRVFGDGSAIRDYIYVRDFAELIANVLDSDQCGTYNVGSGKGLSVSQIIELVQSVTGMEVPVEQVAGRKFDVKEVVLDSDLAMRTFNWYPKISIDEGIKFHFSWLKRVVYGRAD